MLKPGDLRIVRHQSPFREAPVLKESAPVKVVLVPPAGKRLRRMWHKPIRCLEFAESQTEGVFVAMDILIVEVGVFIEPEGETQGRPATLFVNDEFAPLELRLSGNIEPTAPPDGVGFLFLKAAKVGPEQAARVSEFLAIEQKGRVTCRDDVGI